MIFTFIEKTHIAILYTFIGLMSILMCLVSAKFQRHEGKTKFAGEVRIGYTMEKCAMIAS